MAMAESQREASIALENSIKNYLLSTSDVFCLDEIEHAVATQVKHLKSIIVILYVMSEGWKVLKLFKTFSASKL